MGRLLEAKPMTNPFAVFHDSPLPPSVSQPKPGHREYSLPLALETMPSGTSALDELKDTLDHLEAHTAFLRVQLWVHTLLSFWNEHLPALERFGIVVKYEDGVTQTPNSISSWEGWFTQGDLRVGVRPTGEFDTLSEIQALSSGESKESLKPFSQLFVRQVLSAPIDKEGGYLLGGLLMDKTEDYERMKRGWTREEWGQRLASLNLHPEVFGEIRGQQLDAALPAPRSPGRGGPRF